MKIYKNEFNGETIGLGDCFYMKYNGLYGYMVATHNDVVFITIQYGVLNKDVLNEFKIIKSNESRN